MPEYEECEEARRLRLGCEFPWIRREEGGKCEETYAERITPYHEIACSIYGAASGILFIILSIWTINSYLDMEKTKRGSEYRMRMHFFASLSCLFNMLACVDLKSYADRLPLIVSEIFNECAYSCLFVVMFHMVNQWVDVITLGGRQKWGKRQREVLPYMCVGVAVIRVGLGVAQWLVVKDGLKEGVYNGTVNNMKLLCSFVVMGFYTGVGVYSSVYEPMQKSNTSTTPKKPSQQPTGLDIHQLEAGDRGSESKKLSGHDGLGIGRAVKSIKHSVNDKINANLLKKKTVLHTRYLVGLFICLLLYSIYLLSTAFKRLGKDEERGVPCSFISKTWFTGQGIVLMVVCIYLILHGSSECDAKKGGGCAMPTSANARRTRRINAQKAQREIDNRKKAELASKEQAEKLRADREASGVVMNNNPVAGRELPQAATRL